MTTPDLARCRAISEKLGWIWSPTDTPMLDGQFFAYQPGRAPQRYDFRHPRDLDAFVKAVEGTLTEGQRKVYGCKMSWLVFPNGSDDTDEDSGRYEYGLLTAPASVRLQSLREVLNHG